MSGDLTATILAEGSRNRRAGELLGQGTPAEQIPGIIGQASEALDSVPLIAEAVAQSGMDAPGARGARGPDRGRDRRRRSGWPASGRRSAPAASRPREGARHDDHAPCGREYACHVSDPDQGSAHQSESKAELDRAFEELYRDHLRDVYSYAYYRVGNHHDAEDLTEQTFLQAYRHFERARRESDGRPLRPWLIRIAHNLASNYYRDRARRPQTPLDETRADRAPHDTERIVEGREELQSVMDDLQQLPDDRREALIMRFALGMDNREIARALGRSDGATKVLIHRAIKQLEEEMSVNGG